MTATGLTSTRDMPPTANRFNFSRMWTVGRTDLKLLLES